MEQKTKDIEDIISLIKQNFEFLHAGLFLSVYTKKNNLSIEAKNIKIQTDKNRQFVLKGQIIKNSLEYIYINSDKSNILGYFVEWNAFRGIFMSVRQGIENNNFKEYLKNRMGEDKYFHFDAIIRFCRNVLSHNIEDEIMLAKDDFKGSKKYVLDNPCKFENGIVNLEINYREDFNEYSCSEDYGFKITIDFQNMKEGDRFIDIMSEYNLFMLSEFCYNLVCFKK